MDGWNRRSSYDAYCEKRETEGAGQKGKEKCLGSCPGLKWAVDPLVICWIL